MLDITDINVWAVLVVWLVYMVVGAFWYSPAGFANHWTRLTKIDIMKIPPAEATRILLSVAVSSLIQAITLGIIFTSLEVMDVANGLLVGLVLWLGLVTATTVGVTLYQRRSWRFLWLNSAYFFVVMLIGSVIFTVWQ